MAYSVTFTDNQEISASLLNTVKAELGDGVTASEAFVTGETYYTDSLNLIRKDIVSAGVMRGMDCNLVNSKLKISTGLACFENGMRLEIDAEGVELSIASGVTNYVYLYRSEAAQIAMPVISTVAKENAYQDSLLKQEYIPLCTVLGGTVTDMRQWAKSKIALSAGNLVTLFETTIPDTRTVEENWVADYNTSNGGRYRYKLLEFNLPDSTYSLVYSKIVETTPGYYYVDYLSFDFERNENNCKYKQEGGSLYYKFASQYSYIKNGNKLELWYWSTSKISYIPGGGAVTVTVA